MIERKQKIKMVTILVQPGFAMLSPSCPGDRIDAVSVSSDYFLALEMTLPKSQIAVA
jgi:hypothetical protein